MTRPRILVVEDEELVRLMLVDALSDDGFEVVEADCVEAALAALSRHGRMALILTDIQLPGGGDGVALAEAARAAAPDIPVIFMSGRPDSLRGAITARDAFVAKPYLPSQLCALARRLIGR